MSRKKLPIERCSSTHSVKNENLCLANITAVEEFVLKGTSLNVLTNTPVFFIWESPSIGLKKVREVGGMHVIKQLDSMFSCVCSVTDHR